MEQHAQTYLSLSRGIPAQSRWQQVVLGIRKIRVIGLSYIIGFPVIDGLFSRFFVGSCAKIILRKRHGCIHEALEILLDLLQKKTLSKQQTWDLLKWGVMLAQERQLSPDYRLLNEIDSLMEQLKKMADEEVAHAGYDAAYVQVCLALWALQRGEMEMAVRYVALAIQSDETWGYSYFLMGWLACFYHMMDPVPYFIQAISKDWTYFQRIQRDPVLQQYPEVLRDIRQHLQVVKPSSKWKRFVNYF
jgi:hypothetical protein